MQDWAWGFSSAAYVQRVAECAISDIGSILSVVASSRDNLVPEDLRRLAGLGTHGRWPNACSRDLKAWLGRPSMPDPMFVNV